MKNYLKPISMTFMATVLCVSSAHAGLGDLFNPGKIVGNVQKIFPGRQRQPIQPNPNVPQALPAPQLPDYGQAIPASNSLNQAVMANLVRSQIGQTTLMQNTLRSIYQEHGNRAFWTNDAGLSNMGLALKDLLLSMTELHGLSSSNYLSPYTSALIAKVSDEQGELPDLNTLAELEILLTQGYFQFVKDVATGRINPQDPSQGLQDIEMKKNAAPSIQMLVGATGTPEDLFQWTAEQAPKLVGYTALVESLAKLNDGINDGGWRQLDVSAKLKLNGTAPLYSAHPNVIALRQRLVDFGYLPYEERSNPDQRMDAKMDAAIRKFQEYNFLTVDGIVGNDVYKIMNQPVLKFQKQIRANLEKWRLLPRNLPASYIMVDMGRQQLDVVRNNQLALRMNTVVGADVNGTPTMTDKVTSFLLAPYWHSPVSIMVKETIPNFGGNPAGYLAARNVEVLNSNWQPLSPSEINSVNWSQYTMANPPPYTFREKNGEGNSLGLVKFNLTNGHSIYLHDTNNKGAFKKRVRYLSHGCIRLEQPFDLAQYLLPSTNFVSFDASLTSFGTANFVARVGNIRFTTDKAELERNLRSVLRYSFINSAASWRQLALDVIPVMERETAIQKELQSKVNSGSASAAEANALNILKAFKVNPTVDVEDIPVFIFGSTTVNYQGGAIGFGDDVYKQDERIINVLDGVSNFAK